MHLVVNRSTIMGVAILPFLLSAIRQCACADVEESRVVLTPAAGDLVVGPGMDATGRDLRGCEFVTLDLRGAVFDGCNLYGARISGCRLKGASFRGAVFIGSHVEVFPEEGADFTDAMINGCGFPNPAGFHFAPMSLSPKQLMSTWSYRTKNLRQCRVLGNVDSGFDLRGADLREARLGGDLTKCDFTGARIFGAYFRKDTITFEQLASTSDFTRHRLRVRLSVGERTAKPSSGKWDFSGMFLRGSEFWHLPADADFTDAQINDCTIHNGFTRSQLYSTASYKRGDLTGLQLMSSDLSGCDLSGMNLTGCFFSQCKLAGANFDDAVITGARILPGIRREELHQLTVAQIKSTWNYKHGHMEKIRLPDDIAEALK